MKPFILLVVLSSGSFLWGEDSSGKSDPQPLTQASFLNPSTRVHHNNHQERLENLQEAFEAAQKKILDQVVWHVDPSKPIEKVEIHLSEQKLYAYQGDIAVGVSPVCTAGAGYVTPIGTYRICDMKETYFSNLYGEFADVNGNVVSYSASAGQTPPPGTHYVPSPMPHFMRLTDAGMGIHAGYLPGYPASHGCIRLPDSVATNLFKQVGIGTPVRIVE